ncbi:MAG: S1C family serine protease, partial [Alphaproteobacteria bacterium]
MEHSLWQRLGLTVSLCGTLFLAACATPADNGKTVAIGHAGGTVSISQAIGAVVGVYADIPDDAHSARSLGTRRQGSGVLIGDNGLILTIGYLILEADRAGIITTDGTSMPAEIVAYDHDSGFGLLRAKGRLDATPIRLGSSGRLTTGSPVLAVSFEGPSPVVAARVTSRGPFVGYWEYLLDNAIFTAPPHTEYGGAALIGEDGQLLGIGSLLVNDAAGSETPLFGNVFVPIDLLKPILDDLVAAGRPATPAAPWLGLYSDEAEGRVFVTRLATGGPAEKTGIRPGDIIIGVGGHRVRDQIDMYRKIRKQGRAGDAVALDVLQRGSSDLDIRRMVIQSLDRRD